MIILYIIGYILLLSVGAAGFSAVLQRLEANRFLHVFLAALSFLTFVAFAFLGIVGLVAFFIS